MQYRDGPTIYLIDTPGFDDTRRTHAQVLSEVSYSLGATYPKDVKLAGIIYLHSIKENQMKSSVMKNLATLQAMCGITSPANVILATTMWDTLKDPHSRQVGMNRGNELRTTPNYWANMVAGGSTRFWHQRTHESPMNMIDHIMNYGTSIVLDLQRQVVDQKLTLDTTSVGQELKRELL